MKRRLPFSGTWHNQAPRLERRAGGVARNDDCPGFRPTSSHNEPGLDRGGPGQGLKNMKAMAAAALAAVLIQPLVLGLQLGVLLAIRLSRGAVSSAPEHQPFWGFLPISLYVVAIAAVFVACVGIPLFLVLKRLNKLGWASISLLGFLAAAIPYALLSFPLWQDISGLTYGANWHGSYVKVVEYGTLTIHGWLRYLEGTVRLGIHGLAGAAVFYFVWRRLR